MAAEAIGVIVRVVVPLDVISADTRQIDASKFVLERQRICLDVLLLAPVPATLFAENLPKVVPRSRSSARRPGTNRTPCCTEPAW